MENSNINQFYENELTYIKRWDKERGEYVTSPFPKIGGRLRLAHEDNENLSIETEIIRYDERIAVVLATCTTKRGNYRGIGMSSIERDEKIAPAILELAETRAIARSLRFAGYGTEYCSAEEVSHLGNGENGFKSDNGNGGNSNGYHQSNNGNGNGHNGNGYHASSSTDTNGNGRLSSKQYRYIQKLNEEQGRTSADLDKQCLSMFGTVAQHLSRHDASKVIQHLTAAH